MNYLEGCTKRDPAAQSTESCAYCHDARKETGHYHVLIVYRGAVHCQLNSASLSALVICKVREARGNLIRRPIGGGAARNRNIREIQIDIMLQRKKRIKLAREGALGTYKCMPESPGVPQSTVAHEYGYIKLLATK